jgi:hypothetical protein
MVWKRSCTSRRAAKRARRCAARNLHGLTRQHVLHRIQIERDESKVVAILWNPLERLLDDVDHGWHSRTSSVQKQHTGPKLFTPWMALQDQELARED